MCWYKERFIPDNRKIEIACEVCGRSMFFPKCRAGAYRTCSKECMVKRRNEIKEKTIKENTRDCVVCGNKFIARPWQIRNGIGTCCSRKCGLKIMVKAAHTDDANKSRVLSLKRSIEDGKYTPKTGIDNKKWKGGPLETRKRAYKSGKALERLRKYRSENRDKCREWSQNRNRRKYGRLPSGTVKSKILSQKNMCAACGCLLVNGYHVDHKTPLSRGGLHVPENIQILCPSCNVRKWAYTMDEFMKRKHAYGKRLTGLLLDGSSRLAG